MAMTDFAKLVLEADTSGLRRGVDALRDMGRNASTTAGQVDRSNSRMRDSFKMLAQVGIGAAIGAVTGLAAGMVALGYQSIQLADDVYMASQRIGIGTEELSRMKYAAEQSGLSFEQLQTSVSRLSRNMYDASQGAGQGKAAFDALGIAVTNADGTLRTTTEVMGEIAERFSGMENGAQKTALAMELMGRSGTNMIPMLNEGRDGFAQLTDEADRFGVVVTEETGAAAEQFNDNLAKLRGTFGALAANIAAEMLPQLLSFTQWLIDNQHNIRSFAGTFGNAMSGMANDASNFGRNTIREFNAVMNAYNRLAEFDRNFSRQVALWSTGRGFLAFQPSSPSNSGSFASARTGQRRIDRREYAEAQAARDRGAASAARGLLGGFNDVEVAAVSAGSSGGTAIREGINRELTAANDNARELQSLMDRLFPDAARLRQYTSEIVMLRGNGDARGALTNEFRQRGGFAPAIAEETHAVVVAGDEMQRELHRMGVAIEVTNSGIGSSFEEMAQTALGAIDRLSNSLRGGGFLGVLSSVIGLGLQLGSIGVFGSGIQTSLAGKRALGGGVGAGRSYLVGERGPELFTPNAGGYIAANNNSAGGMNVTVTMDPSTGAIGAFVRNQAGQVVASAAPLIADAGAQGGQARMAKSNSRRWK